MTAHVTGNGYQLSETLLPLNTTSQPDRLYAFYHSTNAAKVLQDVRYHVLYDKSAGFHISQAAGKAWIDVYVAYWKAVGEILRAEEAIKSGSVVRHDHSYFPACIILRLQDHVMTRYCFCTRCMSSGNRNYLVNNETAAGCGSLACISRQWMPTNEK